MAKKPTEKERFEVLLEDLRSEFRKVTERVTIHQEHVDHQIRELKQALEHRMDLLEVAVKDSSQRITQLEAAVTEVAQALKQLAQRMDAHEQAHIRG